MAYSFSYAGVLNPRCRNTHTLTPLFALRVDGELVTDPVPLYEVPHEHFWQNSEGYGFDLRNLTALLRNNFRNVNPHAPDRPIWCNERDMVDLLQHLPLTQYVRLQERAHILNNLTDETKRRLAHLGCELYSHSYQGLWNWLRDVPDEVLSGLGITDAKSELQQMLVRLAATRRQAAIAGIAQHSSAQANQHYAEPAGVVFGSSLYSVMEFYKANVAHEFLAYCQTLNTDRATYLDDYNGRLQEYMQVQFLGLCARYAAVLRKEPRHLDRMLLWHWVFRIPSPQPPAAYHRRGLRGALQNRSIVYLQPMHVRVYYQIATNNYVVNINDDVICADACDLWQTLHAQLHVTEGTLTMAALAGGIYEICLGPSWKTTLTRDNALIYSMAHLMTLPRPLFSYLNDIILRNNSSLTEFTNVIVPSVLRTGGRYAVGIRALLYEFTANFSTLYERHCLNRIILSGGYDNGPATLLEKLQGALRGHTCVQDVAAELCEFLSVPYPPQKEYLAAFQVDHTNVPPVLDIN